MLDSIMMHDNHRVLPPAFLHSRLRGYASRLEGTFDASMATASTIALAGAENGSSSPLRAPHPATIQSNTVSPEALPGQGGHQQQQQSDSHVEAMTAALGELAELRAEVAGVESVLGFLRGGSGGGSTAGSPWVARRVVRGGGPPCTAAAQGRHIPDPWVVSREGNADSRAGTPPQRFHAAPWRPKGTEPVGRGEAVILEAALNEMLPPGAITAKYAARDGARATAAAVAATAQEAVQGRRSAPARGGGSLTATLSPVQEFLAGQDIGKDYDMLEMILMEAARQERSTTAVRPLPCCDQPPVASCLRASSHDTPACSAAQQRRMTGLDRTDTVPSPSQGHGAAAAFHCAERGRVLDGVAARLREVFGAMTAAGAGVRAHAACLTHQLSASGAGNAAAEARILALSREVRELRSSRSAEAERNLALEAELEGVRWDGAREADALRAQVDILAESVRTCEASLLVAVAEKNAAVTAGELSVEGQLQVLVDERDDLSQRIRFLERRLFRPMLWSGPWKVVAEEEAEEEGSEAAQEEEEERSEEGNTGGREARPKRKKKARVLGAFQGLVASGGSGRARGLAWTLAALATLYCDKIVADAVADREGNPRSKLAEFTYDWHINKVSLEDVSHILDTNAVTVHFKIRGEGCLTDVAPATGPLDSTQHVSFYLFTIQQMAYPSALTALFPPDTGAASHSTPLMAKYALALEAVRAVFRYLNDEDALTQFVARVVDPGVSYQDEPPVPVLDIDTVIQQLMEEYQRRVARNVAHLQALFKATDTDNDGMIDHAGLVTAVRHIAPDVQDRLLAKMYNEAVRKLPAHRTRGSCIDRTAFVSIMREYGYDRWCIQVISTAATASTNAANQPPSPTTPGARPLSPLSGLVHLNRESSCSSGGSPHLPHVSADGAGLRHGSDGGESGGESRAGSGAVWASKHRGRETERGKDEEREGERETGCVAVQGRTMRLSGTGGMQGGFGGEDSEGVLMQLLDSALDVLEPPLEQQAAGVLDRVRGAAQAGVPASSIPANWVGLQPQLAHFKELYNARVDPPAAWLSFRMLLALVANIASSLRGRPVSSSPVTNISGGIGSIPTSATHPSGASTPNRKLSSLPLLLQPGWRASSASSPRLSLSGLQSQAPPPLNPQNNLGLMGTSLHSVSGTPSSLLVLLAGAAAGNSNENSLGSRSRPGSNAGGSQIHAHVTPKRNASHPSVQIAGMAAWHKHHQTVHHQHPPQQQHGGGGTVRSGDDRGSLSSTYSSVGGCVSVSGIGSGLGIEPGKGSASRAQHMLSSKPALLAHAISNIQQGVGCAQAVVVQPRGHATMLGSATAAFTSASAAPAAAAAVVSPSRQQLHAVQFSTP
ncbi:MAG: hypothetical protein WDW38_011217 [Sanguina aurantia]